MEMDGQKPSSLPIEGTGDTNVDFSKKNSYEGCVRELLSVEGIRQSKVSLYSQFPINLIKYIEIINLLTALQLIDRTDKQTDGQKGHNMTFYEVFCYKLKKEPMRPTYL